MKRGLALVAAALALAGCGGAPAKQAAAPAQPAGFENRAAAEEFLADALAHRKQAVVPGGFRLRTVSEAAVALALPSRWAALRPRDARHPGVLRMFGNLSAVTLTTLPKLQARYERLFDASVRTLRGPD
jgi:hypothetical protein